MIKELTTFAIKSENDGTYIGSDNLNIQNETDHTITSYSPINNAVIASVKETNQDEYEIALTKAQESFELWHSKPAPYRGEIIRQFGQSLRDYKEQLATILCAEIGKPYQEALGEVQEMIDIADFAVGLSRQLYGLSMHSERPSHRMLEQWHPLGIVGIITAFNFPLAVWSWNALIAMVCGNCCIWKPSEKAPIVSLACHNLLGAILKKNNLPSGISCLVNGTADIGSLISKDTRISLVSATGSTKMGKTVATQVAGRLGKYLLELGGNNAMIISENADLEIAIPSIVFGAVGTTGQRCTTTRRIIVHHSIFEEVSQRLEKAYKQLKIGNPLDETNHIGPLIDEQAVTAYLKAIDQCEEEGGTFLIKGDKIEGEGFYVSPSIALVNATMPIVKTETFAPILYMISYNDIEEAIKIQNDVPQGLSSSIMSLNMRETELFLSSSGSDCGIANVNIGTSGAEIGGAFGGEKETGGGRESGSDAWKAYMRRQTVTINYSKELPLAQGIKFEL